MGLLDSLPEVKAVVAWGIDSIPSEFISDSRVYTYKNFLEIGGFSSMRFGEDLDLTYRLLSSGAKSSGIKNAYVYHKRRNNLIEFFNQIFSSGSARVKLNQKHKGTFRFFHLFTLL